MNIEMGQIGELETSDKEKTAAFRDLLTKANSGDGKAATALYNYLVKDIEITPAMVRIAIAETGEGNKAAEAFSGIYLMESDTDLAPLLVGSGFASEEEKRRWDELMGKMFISFQNLHDRFPFKDKFEIVRECGEQMLNSAAAKGDMLAQGFIGIFNTKEVNGPRSTQYKIRDMEEMRKPMEFLIASANQGFTPAQVHLKDIQYGYTEKLAAELLQEATKIVELNSQLVSPSSEAKPHHRHSARAGGVMAAPGFGGESKSRGWNPFSRKEESVARDFLKGV